MTKPSLQLIEHYLTLNKSLPLDPVIVASMEALKAVVEDCRQQAEIKRNKINDHEATDRFDWPARQYWEGELDTYTDILDLISEHLDIGDNQ